MSSFWEKLTRRSEPSPIRLSLVDYAANYLSVFEVGTLEEQNKHAAQLFDAANNAAQHAGAKDFLELIESSSVSALAEATMYSRIRFEEMKAATQGAYWLSAYALTHLMLLNYVKSLEDAPQAKAVAINAAHLYSAEYARREAS